MASAKSLEIPPVFQRFLPVPGAKSIGVSSDKQLISVSFAEKEVLSRNNHLQNPPQLPPQRHEVFTRSQE
jgi:hypothetical protein